MRRNIQARGSVFDKSTLIHKLAHGMSENYHVMSTATDDEAKDFFRCEYEVYKQKYNAELSRIKSTIQKQ